jgi:BirA family biotin operon repressor/biotin-[acetyl-CoA-carboxylase] ligase
VELGRSPFISRREHFAVVGSTNDVVGRWLADGTAEVCVAIADHQTSGRGREGRVWRAAPGTALLMSLGFRPTWLRPEHVWRLAAVVSVAMAEAAERVAGLAAETIRLKWPNDLVAVSSSESTPSVRKIAGILGETTGLGTEDPRAVVGIGTNVDWARAAFPPEIAGEMTSLRELAGGRRLDRGELTEMFLGELDGLVTHLRRGVFDAGAWQSRQLTNDTPVRVHHADGHDEVVTARRVDPDTGGLVVEADGIERTVLAGEIQRVRLADTVQARV